MNKNNETVLVTGGGGFLGFEIIELLLSKNYNVISFSRQKYSSLEKLGIKQIQGDLTKYTDIKNALNGVDAVIHTAGRVGMHGTFEQFYSANFLGTKNLVEAMKELNINKLIYTSTPSVVFGKDDIINGDESLPYPNDHLTFYAHTKKLAEEYVLKSCNANFYALSLRPHLIFGPKDQNLIPRVVEAAKKGRIKIIGDGQNLVDVIHVKNAAYAHYLALTRIGLNLSGKAYFIGQGPVKLWDFINEVLALKGVAPITKKMPINIAYYVGFIIETILKTLRLYQVHPPMSRFIALQLGKSHYFNHHNSKHDLGEYELINTRDAILTLK